MRVEDLPVLPNHSGVYLFKGSDGAPVYIGKAQDLRARVHQHFKAGGKSARFSAEAASLDFITTRNPVEALVLEANLIKQYRPHYNVLLKDDKHYPFLKLTYEPFPMLVITRRVLKDGGSYFGPYPDGSAVKRIKALIDTHFLLRKNSGLPMQSRARPCLNFHMGRCLAPCNGRADPRVYGSAVDDVHKLLEGHVDLLVRRLQAEMRAAAQARNFEQAARIRDQLRAVEAMFTAEQAAVSSNLGDLDVLGFASAGHHAMVQLFRVRDGRVVGRDKHYLVGAEEAAPEEIVGAFLRDQYRQYTQLPETLLLPARLSERDFWEAVLSEQRGSSLRIHYPVRGKKRDLLDLAQKNAQASLDSELQVLERRGEHPGLEALAQELALAERPWRIEGFDNSNLFGQHIVSGMVVFEGGRSRRGQHRRFKVRGLEHPDDYQAMHQTLLRRFAGSLGDKLPLPDLILIDGGHGQVRAALDALRELKLQIPLVGLAKRAETIVLPSPLGAQWWLGSGHRLAEDRELHLALTHPALRMLIAVRDEVHRHAVEYHRALRRTGMFQSSLSGLPGIGPQRQKILLEHFTSLDDIAGASLEDISGLPGMNSAAARTIKAFLANPLPGWPAE